MLEIRNITKKYKPKKGVPVIALNDVSLQFQEKGMVFVLGKSGSGKSTLLNILGGLDQADSGEIIIKGKSSKDFKQSDFDSYRNTYLGFIFQEYNILEEFTVGANIGLAIELQGNKATDEEINRIMEEVDLEGYASRKPNELSGGQKQRVAIARALVKNPEIIMADEPTGALDSKTGIQVFNTLKKLSKDKLVIVVSHDREFAELYGDRVIEFADGKVISDIEKTYEKPVGKSEGVNIVDDSFIYVKKGYKLTPEDLNLINKYIEQSTEEVIISIDNHTNSNIKKFARIDDEGNKEVFKPTDVNRLSSLDIKDPFKLIKSRLPIKDAVKIGASGLRGKPIRLFLTILLSMVSFTLFGLADTMGSYNKVDATVESILDSNINNISFVKNKEVVDEWNSDYSWYDATTMFDADIDYIEEKLGIPFKPIYNTRTYPGEGYYLHNNFINPDKLGSEWDSYYKQAMQGYIEINEAELNELGFTVTGQLPNDYDEIAITHYIYEHFKKAGYRGLEANQEIKAADITETALIGQRIYIENQAYTITAIIDTQVDEERYAYLKESRVDNGFVDYIKIQEFETVIKYGYHALGFVKPGFIDYKINNGEQIGLSIENHGHLYIEENGSYINGISHIAKLSQLESDQIYMFNNKTSLSKGEILISSKYIFERYGDFFYEVEVPQDLQPDYSNYADFISQSINNALLEYANSNYKEAFKKGFSNDLIGYYYEDEFGNRIELTEDQKAESYLYYIKYYDGMYYNLFGRNGIDIQRETVKKIIIEHELLQYVNVEDYTINGYIDLNGKSIKEEGTEYKVVGFFFPSIGMETTNGYNRNREYLIMEDSFYDQFKDNKPGPYSWAIAKMPTSEGQIKKVVEFNYDSEIDGVKFEMQNAVSYLLNQVNGFIEQAAQVFLYIGIGFAVFSSLLLFNFITASIANKKREIGVLRALGARSSDVFSIFFSESLIIALINFTLALIVTIGGILFINNYLRSEYGLLITFLNFGFRQFILMLFVSVAVALISSFFPVYRIAHKKPIDAIKNR